MEFTVENEKQLVQKIYELLRDKLGAGIKVALIGELGAGKTALVKGLLESYGIRGITSPTFTLRKTYETKTGLKIQHIDLYRNPKGHKDPEVEEWLNDEDYLTFVEWPENSSFKNWDVEICLTATGENSRKVEVKWS